MENPHCLIGLLRPPWAVPPELLAVLLPAHYLQHYQGTREKHLPRNVFGVIWRAAQLSVLWPDTGSGEEKRHLYCALLSVDLKERVTAHFSNLLAKNKSLSF